MKLTAGERAVARYLLGGWNYDSISYQLGFSIATVRQYGCNIIKVTGHRTLFSAVMFILRDPKWLSYVMET